MVCNNIYTPIDTGDRAKTKEFSTKTKDDTDFQRLPLEP